MKTPFNIVGEQMSELAKLTKSSFEKPCWNCKKIDCVCDRETEEYMENLDRYEDSGVIRNELAERN